MTATNSLSSIPTTIQAAKFSDRHGQPCPKAEKSQIGLSRARYCLDASRYRVDRLTGCRLWRQALNHGGYAVAADHAGTYMVTRKLYEYVHGSLPRDVHLRFSCRNHACINLAHMEPVPLSMHPGRRTNARLNLEQVGEIRRRAAAGQTHQSLAADFAVSRSTIRSIANQWRWPKAP